MNAKNKNTGIDTKTLLSTLWIFVLLNVIFRDIHELFRPGLLEEMMTGTVKGVQMTEGFLLVAAIMLEIPITMVILSRVLKYNINRWVNIIASALTIASIITIAPGDLDDLFFATIEVVALSIIILYAWKWSDPELSLISEINK